MITSLIEIMTKILLLSTLLVLLLATITTDASAQRIWSFCSGDKQDPSWLLQVNSVKMEPQVPKVGEPFKVRVTGDLKQNIEGDVSVEVDVSYSGVEVYKGKQNVCALGLPCPITAGKMDQTIEQIIPKFAPPGGPYVGTARLVDENNKTFSCIKFNFNIDAGQKVKGFEGEDLGKLYKKMKKAKRASKKAKRVQTDDQPSKEYPTGGRYSKKIRSSLAVSRLHRQQRTRKLSQNTIELQVI